MEEQRQAESSDFASYGQRIRCFRLNEDGADGNVSLS